MDESPGTAVLAGALELATERGWAGPTDFITGLPAAASREITIYHAPGAALPSFDNLLTATVGQPVRISPLELLSGDPGAALWPNRVVVTVPAGELLTPQVVDAVSAVLQRPSGSRLVVVVGAELIASDEDLDTVAGGIWRVLFANDRTRWMGQDLAGHGCLLWSSEPGKWLAERLDRDAGLLHDWLTGPIGPAAELAAARAAWALELLERSASAPESRRPTVSGHRSALEAAETVDDLRRRVLARLDADLAAMQQEATTSLEALEQNLLHDIRLHLDRHSAELTGSAAIEQIVGNFIRDGVRTWMAQADSAVRARWNRTESGSEDLIDMVDWTEINTMVRHPSGQPYPDALLTGLTLNPALTLPDPPEVPGAPAAMHRRRWAPALRTVAYGGALAGISVVALGPLLLPAIAAAAVGAAGGGYVERHFEVVAMTGRAQTYARAATSAAIGNLSGSLRSAIDRSQAPVRRRLDEQFHTLIKELANTVPSQPSVPSESDLARCAALRRRLAPVGAGAASPAGPTR